MAVLVLHFGRFPSVRLPVAVEGGRFDSAFRICVVFLAYVIIVLCYIITVRPFLAVLFGSLV